MSRPLRNCILLIALLVGAQFVQANHQHSDGLSHHDCISCQLHADQKLLPSSGLAPTAIAAPDSAPAYRHIIAPLAPLTSPHNRGPPAFH